MAVDEDCSAHLAVEPRTTNNLALSAAGDNIDDKPLIILVALVGAADS